MRIRIRHQTSYAYAQPVASALQLLRLTPRSHEGQFVRRWRVAIDADAILDRSEDAFGNLTHLVFVAGPVSELRIVAEGEIETNDTNGLVRGASERQPERLFLRPTELTQASPELRAFAQAILAGQGGDRIAALHKMMGELHKLIRFQVGSTSTSTNAAEAFAAKVGVCQDFAHVFIAAARSLGIPTRYVAGYYMRTDTPDQEAGHAWAESHIKGLGWVGFDPAQDTCVTDRHVRVAIGCDYLEAAPVRGAQAGGSEEALSVGIRVEQGGVMLQVQQQ